MIELDKERQLFVFLQIYNGMDDTVLIFFSTDRIMGPGSHKHTVYGHFRGDNRSGSKAMIHSSGRTSRHDC